LRRRAFFDLSVLALVLAEGVRRHVRHMVVVRMTMMYANLHPVENLYRGRLDVNFAVEKKWQSGPRYRRM
jgi:hypothetical protein